jgi:hypothetical protein
MSAALALQAQSPTAFFNFNGGTQGAGPYIFLQGTDGNFYGLSTVNPTVSRTPTIFQITPAGIFTSIYQDESGGNGPDSLTFGSDGNIYGVTAQEGSCTIEPILGCGTVFKVTLQGAYSAIYTFNGMTDGVLPSSLMEGGDGAFYGLLIPGALLAAPSFVSLPAGLSTLSTRSPEPTAAVPMPSPQVRTKFCTGLPYSVEQMAQASAPWRATIRQDAARFSKLPVAL